MFRFTIRDVLWLTVVVALGVGWWLDRKAHKSDLVSQQRAAQERLDKSLAQLKAKMELDLQVERIEHEATRRSWKFEKLRRAAAATSE